MTVEELLMDWVRLLLGILSCITLINPFLGHSRESGLSDGPSNSGSLSPQRRDIEQVEEQIIYGVDSYGMYDQPMPGWE